MSHQDWFSVAADVIDHEMRDEDLREFLRREALESKEAVQQAVRDATGPSDCATKLNDTQ
jgi:hypothetical protein